MDNVPLISLALGFTIAAASALLYPQVVMLLYQQLVNYSSNPVTWYIYFQSYLLGMDVKYFHWMPTGHWLRGLWVIFYPGSFAVDVIFGALGLYPLLPAPDVSLPLRMLWKMAFLAVLVTFFWACFRTVRSFARSGQTLWLIAVAAIAGSLSIALILLARGQYWQAGKALTMASPLLFVMMLLPVASEERLRVARGFALVFLVAQIGWGIARPFAAPESNIMGGHYPYPYPSTQDRALKNDHDWNFARRKDTIRQCRSVAVDIESPIVDRAVQIWLSDLGAHWASLRPLRNLSGQELDRQAPIDAPECLLNETQAESIIMNIRRPH